MLIRHYLFMIISLFTFVVTAFVVQDIIKAWEEKEKFDRARQTSDTIELLLTAGGHWAVERGTTNMSLHSNKVVSEDFANIFRKRRKLGDEAYNKAVKQFENFNIIPLSVAFNTMRAEHEKAVQYRLIADREYKKPKNQRDTEFLKNWVSLMSKQIMATQNLRFLLTQETGHLNPELGRQAYLKHFSWIMSEFAGRERAIIGGAIAAQEKLTHKTTQSLYQYRGEVLAGWKLVKKNSIYSRDSIHKATEKIQKNFFETFQNYRLKIYKAGRKGQEYPTTMREWFTKSTSVIDDILSLQKESIKETNDYIQIHTEQIYLRILFNIAIGIACFLVMAWSIYVITRRITMPLSVIYETLKKLTNSDNNIGDVHIRYTFRNDEIGMLSRGLKEFQSTLMEKMQLEENEKKIREEKQRLEAEERQKRLERSKRISEIRNARYGYREDNEHIEHKEDFFYPDCELCLEKYFNHDGFIKNILEEFSCEEISAINLNQDNTIDFQSAGKNFELDIKEKIWKKLFNNLEREAENDLHNHKLPINEEELKHIFEIFYEEKISEVLLNTKVPASWLRQKNAILSTMPANKRIYRYR